MPPNLDGLLVALQNLATAITQKTSQANIDQAVSELHQQFAVLFGPVTATAPPADSLRLRHPAPPADPHE